MKEGRKERRKEGRKEGREGKGREGKGRRKEGRKEGKKEAIIYDFLCLVSHSLRSPTKAPKNAAPKKSSRRKRCDACPAAPPDKHACLTLTDVGFVFC
jgi:hypothetical protein